MKRILVALLGLLSMVVMTLHAQLSKPHLAGIEPSGEGMWQVSDSRKWREHRPIPYGLREVLQLRPLTFVEYPAAWEPSGTLRLATHGTPSIGLLGEDVEEIIPEAARRPLAPEFNFWQVDYTKLVPVLVRAIQEQHQQLDQRNEDVETLRRELAELRAELELLKTTLMHQPTAGRTSSPSEHSVQEAFLGENIPNPFDQTTRIPYVVPHGVQSAQLHVRSIDGRTIEVVPLHKRGIRADVVLNMDSYATGTYDYALVLDGRVVASRQMVLIK